MKFFIFFIGYVTIAILVGCAATVPAPTQEDIQQLEETKGLFISQLENDMHPVIWAYLDEVLHDPDSFRLQRFEYTLINYKKTVQYEEKRYLFGDQTETRNEEVIVPAYHIKMRYRVRIPAGGVMLKEMNFYLLRDKGLVLPNGISLPLSE